MYEIDVNIHVSFKLDAKTLKDHGVEPSELTSIKDANLAAKKIEMVRIEYSERFYATCGMSLCKIML